MKKPTRFNKYRPPHFHVVISVYESGMGEEQAYWTELTGISFAACKDAEQARQRMKEMEQVYMDKFGRRGKKEKTF